ncbi:hypothetical protein MEN24_20370, partial [Dolichospermum sp. ST_sed10]|nr:hypothetical protein [Dolichospermum sp. ST_sed10]
IEELIETMADLRSVKCDRLTIGQYMRPSLEHLPVQKYWTPEEFTELGIVIISDLISTCCGEFI